MICVTAGRCSHRPLRNSIGKRFVGADAHIGPPYRAPCNASVGATLAVARLTAHLVPVRRGRRLPTVVPTDSRPLLWPPIGALPRNQLASSATGGASPISPTPRSTALLVTLRRGRSLHRPARAYTASLVNGVIAKPVRTLAVAIRSPRPLCKGNFGFPRPVCGLVSE